MYYAALGCWRGLANQFCNLFFSGENVKPTIYWGALWISPGSKFGWLDFTFEVNIFCSSESIVRSLVSGKTFSWLNFIDSGTWNSMLNAVKHFVGFAIFVCNVCLPDFSLSFWRWKRCRSGQATEFRTVHTSVCTRSCPTWRHPRPGRKPAPLCIAPALGVLQSLPVPHCTGRSRYPLKKNVLFEMQFEYGLSNGLCCVHWWIFLCVPA